MKNAFLILVIISFLISCKKETPEKLIKYSTKSFGTVTFQTNEVPSQPTISKQSNEVILNITSIGIAPSDSGYEIRIVAWNGLTGVDLKKLDLVYFTPDNFTSGSNYLINNSYFNSNWYYFDPFIETLSTISYYYYFDSILISSKISSINISGPAEDRYLISEIDSIKQGDITLKNVRINATSFGYMGLDEYSNTVTFDLDDIPSGNLNQSAIYTPHQLGQFYRGERGVDTVKCEFPNNGRNKLKSLEISFTHSNNILAYNGNTGIKEYPEGEFTEIKVLAIDHQGKEYREQQDMGFVKCKNEEVWIKGNGRHENGLFVFEFGFELKSDDGEVISIKNGYGVMQTTWY